MAANHPHKKVLSWKTYTLVFLLYSSLSLSQSFKDADSLINIVETQFSNTSDSMQLVTLEEIYKNNKLKPDLRLKYALKSLKLSNQLHNELWLFKTNYELGNIYKKKGDLDTSLKYYYAALKQNELLDDIRNEALVNASISNIYKVNEDFKNAVKYANIGIKIYREIEDSVNLAINLMNTGEIYRVNQRFDSALTYFKESGDIFEIVGHRVGLAYNIGNIGLTHADLGSDSLAETNLQEAIHILEEEGDFYPIAVYNTYMSDIYQNRDNYEKALTYAVQSLNISLEHSLKEQIRDANLKLSELYVAQNNYQKAYYHQSQYLAYRDSINSEGKIREIAELRTEYEVNKREAEITILKNEKRTQYIIFASMAVIIILLGLASFLYYRNSRRKQTLNLILKERKEEAEAQRDQLEAINETREKFLSIIAHDLMGPVNSFKGLSTIMKMSIDSQDIKDLNDIHRVFDKSVNNLSSLLTNLLDWSVTQQGDIPYHPEKIDFNHLINELIDLFFNMAESKKISLRTNISDNLYLWADVNSTKTILRNLVSNALKFTDAGGEISIAAEKSNSFVVIKVNDTGIGMPQSKIDQLLAEDNFEISQGTQGEKGVGLGLQLVKEFVSMNKGEMDIESEIDKGTTFRIYLPQYNQ
ncbi:tetratricopeptide repeat-containing sensor histidine kinase [Marivirga harenae]|uniref:tetratricopeptide repeat-containing sensor histidine kinase n=1 Tax=Marivirga harenae TaxID=2010992 RepID=UPI0026DF865F|nr:ATP-binding protein [Marivirga harenae]WKV12151.1 ATP-binding protein [Marivirga harenae]